VNCDPVPGAARPKRHDDDNDRRDRDHRKTCEWDEPGRTDSTPRGPSDGNGWRLGRRFGERSPWVTGGVEPDTQPTGATLHVAALDRKAGELELGDDAGWQLDPSVAQLCVADRRASRPPQKLDQQGLLSLQAGRILLTNPFMKEEARVRAIHHGVSSLVWGAVT
jgi:hypothetical protein